MRTPLLSLCLLSAIAGCGTEVTVPPDASGSGAPEDTSGSGETRDTGNPDDAATDASDDTAAASCPTDPFATPACDTEGTRCELGQECCCGVCHPSLVCNCAGGQWACYNTDACMIPSCAGASCTSDADCAGGLPPGATALSCVAGTCTAVMPEGSCIGLPKEGCDTHSASPCNWVEPAGCPDSTHTMLGAAGCYPAVNCTSDSECPAGTYCEPQTQTAPRCAWQEPLCDACAEVRGLCLPRGI